MDTPVLFLVFNRPAPTARVFAAIRKAAPSRLYVAADGPRHDAERYACAKVRETASSADWPCEVKTLFREKNLGCKMAVSSAISWFFENEPEGIILEDDCLPDRTFFTYCAELLSKYRDDPRVMHIGGANFQNGRSRGASYYFSRYVHVWGWASWRRAWAEYDRDMASFPASGEAVMREIFPRRSERAYWIKTMRGVHAGQINTWDYQWAYSVWKAGGFAAVPDSNLVSNIGFGENSTHTPDEGSRFSGMPVSGLPAVLTHPGTVGVNSLADEYTFEHHYSRSILERVRARLSRMF